jgi:hypothetical protein
VTPVTSMQTPRILWRYGQAMCSLRHFVGREASLPCSKNVIRQCLLLEIGAGHDATIHDGLCAGYVQLEAFVSDAEFEMVREFRAGPRDEAPVVQTDPSPGTSRHGVARVEGAEPPAIAILARIAAQMKTRRSELRGGC